MKERMVVWGAEITAAWRAIESARPQKDRICHDPLAKAFLSVNPIWRAIILWIAGRRLPGAVPALAARTAHFDNYLAKCIGDGIDQMVNLGAGYDSRAYRFEELRGAKVFEIDHPATLKVKVGKVRKLFGALPGHVVYVPINFEKEKLDKRLLESGYQTKAKTLFIGEAIVHHLKAEEVDSILDFIVNNSGRGSSVIFDYIYQSIMDGTNQWKGTKKWHKGFKRSDGHPPFGIKEGNAEDFLSRRGFHKVTDASGEFLRNEHIKEKDEGRETFTLWGIVHATVKPRE
jgi:methyltransferase (TIGR00027 family)